MLNILELQFLILISSVVFFSAEMNRHHYSLYVHNCRLIFLLRQEPSEAENYKPAEFHWKLDQVRCFQNSTLCQCTAWGGTYKVKNNNKKSGFSVLQSLDFSFSLILLSSFQVCDKEWHHYVLNVEFPTVSVFVDGTTFEPFLVTEDYPLHASKIETQLTIGACWQGKPCNWFLESSLFWHLYHLYALYWNTSSSFVCLILY